MKIHVLLIEFDNRKNQVIIFYGASVIRFWFRFQFRFQFRFRFRFRSEGADNHNQYYRHAHISSVISFFMRAF
jgi:hypothetical protein